MSHQYHSAKHTQRHLELWIYLLPIVGVIPSLWTLYRPQSKVTSYEETLREQQKVSRLSISLALVWLTSYSLLSLSADNFADIISFRLLYTNAVITTGYFLTCTFLMTRLNKKSLPIFDDPNH